jgi:hypothetical protein
MLDAFGKALIEIRDDPFVAAITDRIRGHEPGPDDAKGPGEYVPFVVLSDLGFLRGRRGLPIQTVRINVRAYAATYTAAKALFMACSDAVHDVGPRIHANGLGIYQSHDDTGGSEGYDPRTKQPYVEGVIELIATTSAVAA